MGRNVSSLALSKAVKGGGNLKKPQRPLTGVGLTLFRIWLYAPFPSAFGVLAILTLTSPHMDRVGVALVAGCMIFGWLSFLWVRRLERRFGLDGLTVQMTAATFGMMVLFIVLYPIMSHQIHVLLHPNSTEYAHWEMLPMFAQVCPVALIASARLFQRDEGSL